MKVHIKSLCGILAAACVALAGTPAAFAAESGNAAVPETASVTGAGVCSALFHIVESQEANAAESADAQEQNVDPEWENRVMPKLEDEGNYLNVRSDADASSEVVGKLYRGASAEILEKGDEWTKVSSGNLEGYIRNDNLAFGNEAKEIAERQGTWKATVNTQTLNIRKEASNEAEIAGLAANGEEFELNQEAETVEGWIPILYNGETAYAAQEFVDTELVLGTGVTLEEEQAALAAEKAAEQEQAERDSDAQKASQKENTDSGTTAAAAGNSGTKKASGTSSSTAKASASTAGAGDVTLLAALIQCEAGGEPYEGQLAVGAVVLNRVASSAYPNSISGVVYQSGQFGPASNGSLARTLSTGAISSSCYTAAQEALAGRDNVNGALYFGCGNYGMKIGNHYFH